MTTAIAPLTVSKFVKEFIGVQTLTTLELVEMNDYCVNWLRDFGRTAGWRDVDLRTCVDEELNRVRGLEEDDGKTLLERYYRARRTGSRFRVTRDFRTVLIGLIRSRSLI